MNTNTESNFKIEPAQLAIALSFFFMGVVMHYYGDVGAGYSTGEELTRGAIERLKEAQGLEWPFYLLAAIMLIPAEAFRYIGVITVGPIFLLVLFINIGELHHSGMTSDSANRRVAVDYDPGFPMMEFRETHMIAQHRMVGQLASRAAGNAMRIVNKTAGVAADLGKQAGQDPRFSWMIKGGVPKQENLDAIKDYIKQMEEDVTGGAK